MNTHTNTTPSANRFLLILSFTLSFLQSFSTSYTWNGNTSTTWTTTTNWTPNGTPASTDNITIATGTYAPHLSANVTVNNFTISGNTFDLSGDTLTINGNATFSGGTITNGLLKPRGGTIVFSGTTIDVPVDAIVATIKLNGSTFNKKCYLEANTNIPGTSDGGNTFNDTVTIKRAYTGSGIMYIGHTSGNVFNKLVTFINVGTKEIETTTVGGSKFNDNVIIENSSSGGINFGYSTTGSDTLASGKTITIGGGGFTTGVLVLRNFIQLGSTAQSLTVTSSAVINLISSTFNGNLTLTAPGVLCKSTTCNGTFDATVNGSTNVTWSGYNIFNSTTSITNTSTTADVRLDNDSANTFYGNLTLTTSSSKSIKMCYSATTTSVYGNVWGNNGLVTYNTGSGTLAFRGGNAQTFYSPAAIVKDVLLKKSANNVTLDTTLTVTATFTFNKGNIITTSNHLLSFNSTSSVSGASDTSFVSGPVKKTGNSAFVFPTGKGSECRPIIISAPSNSSDAFSGEYFHAGQTLGSTIDTTIDYISECNYWSLSRNNGTSNVYVSLSWDSSACTAFNRLEDIRVSFWDNTKWSNKGNSLLTGDYDIGNVKSSSTISSFGYFTWGLQKLVVADCVLPPSPGTCLAEYVCNGGFEQGCASNAPLGAGSLVDCFPFSTKVTNWHAGCLPLNGPYLATCDLYIRQTTNLNYGIPNNQFSGSYGGVNTWDWSTNTITNNRYIGGISTTSEGVITNLIYPIVPGPTYSISFYATTLRWDTHQTTIGNSPFIAYLQADDINGSTTVPINQWTITNNGWNQYTHSFSLTSGTPNMENLILRCQPASTGYWYTFFDDVSLVGPSLILSSSSTHNCNGATASGSATVTVSNGSAPYHYVWSTGANTTISSTSHTITGLATGNYTVTVTDNNSCSSTIIITVVNGGAPAAPVISGVHYACGGSHVYSLVNPPGTNTYSWVATWSGGSSNNPNATSATITWPSTGGYIVFTATNSYGCTASTTLNVYPCCTGDVELLNTTSTDIKNNLIVDPAYYNYYITYSAPIIHASTGSPTSTPVITINGTLTIDNYDMSFFDCNIIFGPDAQIIVNNGRSLTFENCYLHGCGNYMWQGITIDPNGNTYYYSSWVEDAQIAVTANSSSGNPGKVVMNNCIFNKNHLNTVINAYNGTYPGTIRHTIFQCTPIYNSTTNTAISLPPWTSTFTISGVDIYDVNDITIGIASGTINAPDPAHSNYFEGLNYGIRSYRSNVDLANNVFEFITNKSLAKPVTGGYAVFCEGSNSLSPKTLNVGPSLYDFNFFNYNDNGVYAQFNYNVNVAYCTFDNGTSVANGIGVYTYMCDASALNIEQLNSIPNSFTGFKFAVRALDCTNSTINITGNTFVSTATNINAYAAIRLDNSASGFQNLPNTTDVTLNDIDIMTGSAISLVRYDNAVIGGPSSGTDPNTISMNLTSPPATQVFGIRVQNSSGNVIEQNTISRPSVPNSATYNNRVFGISVENSTGTAANNIIGNTLSNMGSGLYFNGNNTNQTIQCNLLDHNWSDVRIFSGIVGNQVQTGSTDQNNSWSPISGSNRGIVGYIPIPPSDWFVANSSFPPLTNLQMFNSGVSFPTATVTPNTSCPPFAPNPPQSRMVDIAYEQNYGDSLSDEEKYRAKKQVYHLLAAVDSLMHLGTHEDTLLTNWFDSTSTANIGLFKTVADSLCANSGYAAEVNTSITPDNHAEENEQLVNAIYLSVWANDTVGFPSLWRYNDEEYETLNTVASENPMSGGMAVYMAYTMLDTNAQVDPDEEARLAHNTFSQNNNSKPFISDSRVTLKPNPAGNHTVYAITLSNTEVAEVIVYTQYGNQMQHFTLTGGSNQKTINTTALPSGVYLLKTTVNHKVTDMRKFTIIN